MTVTDAPTDASRDQETLRQLIAGAIAELDLRQIEITRRLTPAQHCQEGLSMIRLAEHARRSGRAHIACANGGRS